MLNDVVSLIVALYALKLAANSTRSSKYSYGWQRAEILGALVNGVFLLALCFSIFMEAIQRLFGAPEVGSPKLVVIVGSFGLLSNIVGLFLFHDHGHSHGGDSHGHDHGHSHGSAESAAERGHNHKHTKPKQIDVGSANGDAHVDERSPLLTKRHNHAQPEAIPNGSGTPLDEQEDSDTLDELLRHPAQAREAIVRQAQEAGFGSPRNNSDAGFGHRRSMSVASKRKSRPISFTQGGQQISEESNAAPKSYAQAAATGTTKDGHRHSHQHAEGDGHVHEHDHEHDAHQHGDEEHDHDEGHHEESHGGHSHGDMNMVGWHTIRLLPSAHPYIRAARCATTCDWRCGMCCRFYSTLHVLTISPIQLGNVGVIA